MFKFVFWVLIISAVFTSIVEKKISDIHIENQDEESGVSYFSRLQRKLKQEAMDEPVPLANLGMEAFGRSELTFPHDLDQMRRNLTQFRQNIKALVPPKIKNAAINVYITNAELLSKNNFDLNGPKLDRNLQDGSFKPEAHDTNIRLTNAVKYRPERMLKQVRGKIDDSAIDPLKESSDETFETLKRTKDGSMFDLNLDQMYEITKEDLDTFNSHSKLEGRR